MTLLNDLELLIKKIAVTIIIYLIPVSIVTGGLLLIQHTLGKSDDESKTGHKINITENKQK